MKKVLFLVWAACLACAASAQMYYLTPDGRIVQMGQPAAPQWFRPAPPQPQWMPPPQQWNYVQPYAGATPMYSGRVAPPQQIYYPQPPQYRYVVPQHGRRW